MTNTRLLQLENVSVRLGSTDVLSDINLDVDAGEILLITGPNGAGKSMLLKALYGLVNLSSGRILFRGRAHKMQAHQMVDKGIAYVPQVDNVFLHMSVEQNLLVGGLKIKDRTVLRERIGDVYKLYPVLQERKDVLARKLSGGQRQMLAIGRALVSDPSLLLLDEPTSGLSPQLTIDTFAKLREINEVRKTALIVVEHNSAAAQKITDRITVLDGGVIDKVNGTVLRESPSL